MRSRTRRPQQPQGLELLRRQPRRAQQLRRLELQQRQQQGAGLERERSDPRERRTPGQPRCGPPS